MREQKNKMGLLNKIGIDDVKQLSFNTLQQWFGVIVPKFSGKVVNVSVLPRLRWAYTNFSFVIC